MIAYNGYANDVTKRAVYAPDVVEVFVRAPAAEQDAAQTRGASLMFCRWRDLELLAPYTTRVRRGWGVRW
jgi:hypothetical protein